MGKTDPLSAYKKKRDFQQTAEPTGEEKITGRTKNRFVIQMHDARNLHFDFRLQIGDVLVSWAVPKGPSTDPDVKRLAIRTEDHPFAYGNFEGVIPEGAYGGGTVLIWDHGTFRNLRIEKKKNPMTLEESLEDGLIEVWLEGEKLEGGYALIRTQKGENEKWLLKKIDDEKADARRNPVSTERKSVVSGLGIDEIAEKAEHE